MTTEHKKPLDPRVFRGDRIDPMRIYGFADFVNGKTNELRDHPEFPNPRSPHNMDLHTIEEVQIDGVMLEPIKLYFDENGDAILIDGKTRMTGVGLFLRRNPGKIGKIEVPLIRVKGDANEIRLLMLKYNTKDSRRPLTDADVSKYLRMLDAQGIKPEEQLKVLDKTGKGGMTWLNHMKQILDANPAVTKAYEDGKIDFTSAKMIAKAPWEDQVQALSRFLELKAQHPDLTEADIRKMSGVKKANRITQGFDSTIEFLSKEVLLPGAKYLNVDRAQEAKWKEMDMKIMSMIKAEGLQEEYEAYMQYHAMKDQLEAFAWFLKLTDSNTDDQIKFILENASQETKDLLEGALSADKVGQKDKELTPA